MEYHLDRKIIFEDDSEYSSLYKWSLSERTSDKNQDVTGLIPWEWTLHFKASTALLNYGCEIDRFTNDDSTGPAFPRNQVIHVGLKPHSPKRRSAPTFSMFGTGRTIKDFRLLVRSIETEDESVRSWGGVSYTAESDFLDETHDDVIVFYLYVKPEMFERLALGLRDSSLSEITFSVGRVSGFYAKWSPSISTDFVKVLASSAEQKVEGGVPNITLPRLGHVGEFNLTFSTKREFGQKEEGSEFKVQPIQDGNEHHSKIENLKISKHLFFLLYAILLILIISLLKH